tara:strand:- start:80 stop:277 length:198 start_codon:yes stop_codon:yes gene_type:complete
MESFKNSKGIKVQSAVYPKNMLSFNEWAQNLDVSNVHEEPKKHTRLDTPFKVERTFVEKLFGITK